MRRGMEGEGLQAPCPPGPAPGPPGAALLPVRGRKTTQKDPLCCPLKLAQTPNV